MTDYAHEPKLSEQIPSYFESGSLIASVEKYVPKEEYASDLDNQNEINKGLLEAAQSNTRSVESLARGLQALSYGSKAASERINSVANSIAKLWLVAGGGYLVGIAGIVLAVAR